MVRVGYRDTIDLLRDIYKQNCGLPQKDRDFYSYFKDGISYVTSIWDNNAYYMTTVNCSTLKKLDNDEDTEIFDIGPDTIEVHWQIMGGK